MCAQGSARTRVHISAPGAHLPSPPSVPTPRPSGASALTWPGAGRGRAERAGRRGRGCRWAPHAAPTARSNFPSRLTLRTPPVHRREGSPPPRAPPASPTPPPALPARAPPRNLRSRSERMCYNLGAAAAATTAPAPEPEPEPPLPRLPGRPRARHALSPPPPRARPALDAVSAAARLPPAPLLSPSQAEPSPAGSGSGGQGARGRRRSVWSQRGRWRKSWRKEGKPPPPPPRSGDLGACAPLARDRASGPWPAPRPR